MRDRLAEQLLAKVMDWTAAETAAERPRLQTIAAHKYDEYQQFAPGMRFVESLALWLRQFSPADRRIAYRFAVDQLVFCSAAEMGHLVSIAYPDHVRPRMLRKVAEELSLPPWQYPKAASTPAFHKRRRQTLFLGLSDGSRIDMFRRANPDLSNEQVWQSYELGPICRGLRPDHGSTLTRSPWRQ